MRRLAVLCALLASLAGAGCAEEGCGPAPEDAVPAPSETPPPGTPLWAAPSRAQIAEGERLGVPVAFENALGMRFVLVPAGWFDMGSAPEAPSRSDDEALHPAQMLVAFYVQAEETTWGAWKRVFEGAPSPARAPEGAKDDDAVAGVAHAAAAAFAARLAERDILWRYRLPTEAEWERAARAGDAFPREGGRNAWGVAGTSAGVWEWCSDRYGPYPEYAVMNPTGPREGAERVLRGGAIPAREPMGRLRARRHAAPDAPPPDAGVRLVATLSYGKSDVGAVPVTFVVVDDDAPPGAPREPEGAYEVRLIAVFDRLYSRQQGIKPLPWVTLKARAPVTLRVPPGRYYAQAQRPGGGLGTRGVEEKITVDGGPLRVELQVPRPGQTLDDPQ